jgi:hypothetical protein
VPAILATRTSFEQYKSNSLRCHVTCSQSSRVGTRINDLVAARSGDDCGILLQRKDDDEFNSINQCDYKSSYRLIIPL